MNALDDDAVARVQFQGRLLVPLPVRFGPPERAVDEHAAVGVGRAAQDTDVPDQRLGAAGSGSG